MAQRTKPEHRTSKPQAAGPPAILAKELKAAAERLIADLPVEGTGLQRTIARVIQKMERAPIARIPNPNRTGDNPIGGLATSHGVSPLVDDFLERIEKLPDDELCHLMRAIAPTASRVGFAVVNTGAMVTRMCDIVVEFRFMPTVFWDSPDKVKTEIRAFIERLEASAEEGMETVVRGVLCLAQLVDYVERSYGRFTNQADPDFFRLLVQIHQEIAEQKRKSWRDVYIRWVKLEPRLAKWCKDHNVLRVRYHRELKYIVAISLAKAEGIGS